jgi:hypothetical protein
MPYLLVHVRHTDGDAKVPNITCRSDGLRRKTSRQSLCRSQRLYNNRYSSLEKRK